MRTHGFHPTEEELRDMIRNVDTNANGAIDFNEFIEMMVKRDSRIEDDVAHAFKVFDRDGDGLISEEELRLTMNNLGEPLTEAEVKSMIAEADLDGDGKINFQEFSRLMANSSGASSGSHQSKGVWYSNEQRRGRRSPLLKTKTRENVAFGTVFVFPIYSVWKIMAMAYPTYAAGWCNALIQLMLL